MYYLIALQNKYYNLKAKVKSFLWNEAGQTMTEYGLLILLIALALIVAVMALGGSIGNLFREAGDQLNTPPTPY
jgi:pilus assembly protein Flp/PilA